MAQVVLPKPLVLLPSMVMRLSLIVLLHQIRDALLVSPHGVFVQSAECTYDDILPKKYVTYKTNALSPDTLDGHLDKEVWNEVPWTDDFVDIATTTNPQFRTRAKVRWDDQFLYVGALLEDPNVWATLTDHDSIIFHDNDFEIFVDPNATTHFYKEFEINALNTTWELVLNKAYGDGGYENSTRVFGTAGWTPEPPLRASVQVQPDNSLNDPLTPSHSWTLEVALPIEKMMENNTNLAAAGKVWRINFSRVQWGVAVVDGQYEKTESCQSCAVPGTAAEDNWVWSSQGEVSMHQPDRWGLLFFSDDPPSLTPVSEAYAEWPSRSAAMALYYAQKAYKMEHGHFATDLADLLPFSASPYEVCASAVTTIEVTTDPVTESQSFVASVASPATPSIVAIIQDDRKLTVAR
uniref:Carbohydrate-binding domain-containing protein n=1 Tax=Noctiluca scintillans TaxID=2966 RepID=A0A7S1A251_NOCSC